MPLTNFPNGISTRVTSATNSAAGDNDLTCLDLFADGTVNVTGASSVGGALTGATGSVYGSKVSLAFGGSAAPGLYTVALDSNLYDSGATIRAPFKCLPEIVYVQGATVGITVSVRVNAGSVSTASDVATLTVGSATNTVAQAVYTTIGGTAIGQGSFLHVTSAVQVTANTSALMINLIPVA
jgi:hypothetical protein